MRHSLGVLTYLLAGMTGGAWAVVLLHEATNHELATWSLGVAVCATAAFVVVGCVYGYIEGYWRWA